MKHWLSFIKRYGAEGMYNEVGKLVAKVTRRKSAERDRFQCWELHQLWDNGQVTVDHCIEDEEWGGIEESRDMAEMKDYPEDFFRAGFSRVIHISGSIHEEPL